MENRRLLFAAFMSALVLILWNHFLISNQPPVSEEPGLVAPESGETERQGADGTGEEPAAGTSSFPSRAEEAFPETEAAMAEQEPPALDFGAETVVAPDERRVRLETSSIIAELSNRGAQLLSWKLLDYTDADDEPLELIRPRGTDPHPFALVVDGERSHPLNRALFEVTEETGPEGLPLYRFRHKSELGTAEKIFRITPEGLLAVEVTLEGRNWGLLIGPGLRQVDADDLDSRWTARQATWMRGGEIEKLVPKKAEEDVYISGTGLQWAALEDNFFLTAVMPVGGLGEILIRPVVQRVEFEKDRPRFLPIGTELAEETNPELMMVLQASGRQMELLTFLGGKQYSRLRSLPYGLEETVHWGSFIGIFARPLYFGLEWIYANVVANYGWAIVLVTCIIKLLFFPLTFKSQQSMAKMQELNPKVQAIRAKYKGKLKDKKGRPNIEAQKTQNDEVMKVYKEAGVNPVSGCFPILLQMPVFFAFFRLLSTAVELRDAAWLAWIQDLSAKDPYYILPLIMGVTSIAMQKTMPQSPDPMQRRMMQLMPIMFTIFALAFPAGLVLYWVTNNLLTMLQQLSMNWFKKKNEGDGKGEKE